MKAGLSEQMKQCLSAVKSKIDQDLPPSYSDVTLLRFIKAHKMDVEKSVLAIQQDIKWRLDNKVETILEDFPKTEEGKKLIEYWPCARHGVDVYGNPIYIERSGKLDVKGILENFSYDALFRCHVYLHELDLIRYNQFVEERGFTEHGGFVCIMDLSGLNWSHLNRKVLNAFKELILIDQDHYPEVLYKMYLVNTPSLFSLVWKFAKSLIDPETLVKVNILGTNFLGALETEIDKKNLPKFLGGECSQEHLCVPLGGPLMGKGTFESNESYQSVQIKAGGNYTTSVKVEEEGCTLSWQFNCDSKQIGFAIYREAGSKREEVFKYTPSNPTGLGQLSVSTGNYVLFWDNKSTFRKKTVNYFFFVEKPEQISAKDTPSEL